MCGFSIILILKGIMKSKGPSILLNKNINFNKNGTELKMENPPHTLREKNLGLKLISESWIKSKTDELELGKEKRVHFFVMFILSEESFSNICFMSIFSVLN